MGIHQLNSSRQKQAAREWINERNYDLFVTLAFNPLHLQNAPTSRSYGLLPGGIPMAKERLWRWDAYINRSLNGPKWSRHYDDRLMGIAFLEHPDTNTHWHLLLRHPANCTTEVFRREVQRAWHKLTPAGTTNVQRIHDGSGIVDYVTKELTNPKCWENFEILGSLQ